ncbi:T9SS type A sorting domain-containing protein [Candidatus Fermentibacteria bacterium]|nr:T9SS type A sorting domain-containing protein [Candidatus Fermentibacteria bacterium]
MRPVRLLTGCILPFTLAAHASDIVWVTTDFSTGGLAAQTAGECAAGEVPVPVPGDAVVRSGEGYVFVVGRLGYDNVTVLHATGLASVVHQYSTGNGTNPQDMLTVAPDRAFITLFERSWMLIVNPITGEIVDTVDLSPFADADGIPEATRIIRHGERVYIVCQRLDRNTPMMDPAGPGCLAVLDAYSGQPVDMDPATPEADPLWLPAANPTAVTQVGSTAYLPCTGNWNTYDDGAVVAVDLALNHVTVIMDEQAVGANVGGIAAFGQTAYLAVSYPDWSNAVVPCDLATGILGLPLPGPSGGYIPDMLVHEGILYVADQGTWADPSQAGVLLIDASTGLTVCGPVSTGLPPMCGAVVTPATAIGPSVNSIARVWPNPTLGRIHLCLNRPSADATFALYDHAGRRMVRATLNSLSASFDLRECCGELSTGTYVVRVSGPGIHWTTPLVIH